MEHSQSKWTFLLESERHTNSLDSLRLKSCLGQRTGGPIMDLTGTSVGEPDIWGLEKALQIYYEVYIYIPSIYICICILGW